MKFDLSSITLTNLVRAIRQPFVARAKLRSQIRRLHDENAVLRKKIETLHQDRVLAEARAEERLREKENLRKKLVAQQKLYDGNVKISEQLSTKITELRDEIERLRQMRDAG